MALIRDPWIGDQHFFAYQQLIRKTEQNDNLVLSLLGMWKGSPLSFTNMRRSLWSDQQYYSEAFLEERVSLTSYLICRIRDLRENHADSIKMIRLALAPTGAWAESPLGLSPSSHGCQKLLYTLAGIVGSLRGRRPVKELFGLITDVVSQLPGLGYLSNATVTEAFVVTPLLKLIVESFSPNPLFCLQHRDVQRGRLTRSIQLCESSVRSWLESLQVAGVDLCRYGWEERQRHVMNCGVTRVFEVADRCVMIKGMHRHFESGEIRLISFDFGESPSQWRFWWSEVTDDFAGDFWNLVKEQEISDLKVPGAWVEDHPGLRV